MFTVLWPQGTMKRTVFFRSRGITEEPALPVAPDFDARCRQVLEGLHVQPRALSLQVIVRNFVA